jgi:hypothetical protein
VNVRTLSARCRTIGAWIVIGLLAAAPPLRAQESPASDQPAPAPTSTEDEDEDTSIDEAEPDFTLVNLSTALPLARFKSAFRVTHRFARPLGEGDFGDLADDFFGFDNGAQIGLEYRFGVTRDAHVGIHRTSDKTIQFFGQYQLRRASETQPLGAALLLSVEGLNNFRDEYSPALGAVISYRWRSRGALYVEPVWVGNTILDGTVFDDEDEDSSLVLGLGARIALAETVYVVGEFAPRVAGFRAGDEHVSFGLEKRVGGHVFQINFSNGIGSTRRQLVKDATEDWFIGFNISRKLW